ncbi:DENN (AEX-3) domain-containing protein [Actinidia rufa]|uniref:DENN (AEX-3) domain-containing protein n=1 Tax=Actinidia rufa TaxID=165716 RepID=A0A7J0GJB6_9ERIC|nr:DENN (AEX-3) domain-containing protein [Actinidia rufa]
MAKNEDSGSPGWSASLLLQPMDDVARPVEAAAAAATTVPSTRPSDHRPLKEPSRIFESMVFVGLHPNCDIQALQKLYFGRKFEGSGKFRSAINGHHQSRVERSLEPQVIILSCKIWSTI